ncbi:MAG: prepilin peptidase [Proteobacteria bacterium]|nr:prepilin peptidase [Pseudomonadota bacterium]MBU1611499.1 prepilin peptidase [Pseudomonadota bacterium]
MFSFPTIIVGAALLVAVYTDIREQRIHNWLTFSVAIVGIAFHGLTEGVDGLSFAFSGLGLGLAVMILPYLLGFMGGGDVKLMAAIGACLGASDIFTAFLFTSFAGGAYALGVLLFRMDLFRQVMRNLWTALWLFSTTRKMEYAPVVDNLGETRTMPRLCYGVAIAVGTVTAMVWSRHMGNLF